MGRFEKIQIFVRIVDAGSISRAAQQLHMTKSSVSKALSSLEQDLGVKLLARTTRSQSLTDSGEGFYQHAQRILPEVDALFADTEAGDTAVKGHLKVSVPLSFGIEHLSPALQAFMLQYPQVQLEVFYDDARTDLVEGGFDLAFRIGSLSDSLLQAKRICPIGFSICASPDYLTQNGPIKQVEQLEAHPFLKYASIASSRFTWTSADAETFSVNLNTRFIANNGEALLHMAEQGLGVAVIPNFIAYKALQGGRLIAILKDTPLPVESAWAVYPQTRYLPQRTRLFIDHLVDWFAGEPYWEQS